EGGARVQSPSDSPSWDVNLGYQRGGKGEATISGAGSVWELGRVVTGYYGQGSIHVQDGGAVRRGGVVLGGTWYGAGGGSGHTGSGVVEIVGKGSSWTSNDSLTVGGASASSVPSTLTISGGGTFSSASGAIIGSDYSSRGSVTVDGPGSHWS